MEFSSTFPQFQRFPLEIRLLVWYFALPIPGRRIYPHNYTEYHNATFPLLLTCKESQQVFLLIYTHLANPWSRTAPPIFVDLKADMFHHDMFPKVNAVVLTDFANQISRVKRAFIPIQASFESIQDGLSAVAFTFLTYHYTRNPQIEEVVLVLLRVEGTYEGGGIRSCEREKYLEYLKGATGYAGWNNEKWKVLAELEWLGRAGEWKLPRILFDIEDLVVDRKAGSVERKMFDMADIDEKSAIGVGKRWPPVAATTGES